MADEPLEVDSDEAGERRGQTGTLVDALPALPPRRARWPWALLGSVLILGTLAAALGFYLHRSGRDLSEVAAEFASDLVGSAARNGDDGMGEAVDEGKRIYVPGEAPGAGMVYVDSTPPGAEVWVAGERLGITPLLTQRSFTEESVRIELRKAGYLAWSQRVDTREGIRVEATLRRK
ncbi:MAG: PEGA domain-containing protein [Deltaproteobacteria bacterium]|nr:MAG: PEGA domain-containing protein [Deltaproteobacteria bacterium]